MFVILKDYFARGVIHEYSPIFMFPEHSLFRAFSKVKEEQECKTLDHEYPRVQ